MKKHLKLFALLLIVATTMNCFISCNKDDDKNTATTGTGTWRYSMELSGTEWRWSNPDLEARDITDISVGFNGPTLASLNLTDMSTGIMNVQCYIGTYTYSGGRGTMSLQENYSSPMISVPFSVNGTTMTIQYQNTSYTLTKM